ncbi:hypothetical protein ID866_5045 [Astraeus odoratus]|nr:hypothetical protein ID866_5045 [Astraeus odoratus]
MANVVYPQFDFLHNPVNHTSSRFGFGYGLSGSASIAGRQEHGHRQPAAFQQLTSHTNIPQPVQRVQKRRHEPDDEADSPRQTARDVTMDRSPTPERTKRAVPKRARMTQSTDAKNDAHVKEGKHRNEEDDVDVGVLLASLPPQSLLPLLNAMISAQPSLKSLILPLIPRPTLEMAIQALDCSARKLREAYPYSNAPTFVPVSLGFGFGGPHRPTFNNADCARSHTMTEGSQMRESYILSRLRPHINDFVSACMSYVPYFSYVPAAERSPHGTDPASRSYAAALQLQHEDKSHPSETFSFLSALTSHIISQPPLTQTSLAPLLLPRLSQEWVAWIDRIDEVVNREGGMFGVETVRGWERTLDELADARGPEGWNIMKDVRDRWVAKVGWLSGRSAVHPMEEEV